MCWSCNFVPRSGNISLDFGFPVPIYTLSSLKFHNDYSSEKSIRAIAEYRQFWSWIYKLETPVPSAASKRNTSNTAYGTVRPLHALQHHITIQMTGSHSVSIYFVYITLNFWSGEISVQILHQVNVKTNTFIAAQVARPLAVFRSTRAAPETARRRSAPDWTTCSTCSPNYPITSSHHKQSGYACCDRSCSAGNEILS